MQLLKQVVLITAGLSLGLLLLTYGVLGIFSQQQLTRLHSTLSRARQMRTHLEIQNLGGPVVVRIISVGFIAAGLFFIALVLHIFF
jgi:hypothetical protein